MGKRRRRRTRSDDGGRRASDGFDFRHGPLTIEGEIERLGAFASGASRARGLKRWAAVFLVVLIVGPLAVGLLVSAVRLLTG